jgi:hypothetical protein
MQKSVKFFLEMLTVMSSEKIMDIDEAFSIGGRSFI